MRKNLPIASLTSLLPVLFAARSATAQTDHKRFELGAQIVSSALPSDFSRKDFPNRRSGVYNQALHPPGGQQEIDLQRTLSRGMKGLFLGGKI